VELNSSSRVQLILLKESASIGSPTWDFEIFLTESQVVPDMEQGPVQIEPSVFNDGSDIQQMNELKKRIPGESKFDESESDVLGQRRQKKIK
jgi:hypothetical protein